MANAVNGLFRDLSDAAGHVLVEANNLIEGVRVVGESTSLQVMAQAAAKNVVYIGTRDPSISQIISARSNVLEAGLIAAASFIHNFVMGLVYGIGALINMGQNAALNGLAKRSLVHMGISFSCATLGLFGLVSPELAARGTANLVNAILANRAEIAAFLA